MFIRDYSLNTMVDCDNRFFDTGIAILGRDYDALWLWCMGS